MKFRLFPVILVSGLLTGVVPLQGQPERIQGAIDNTRRVEVLQHAAFVRQTQYDRGPSEPSFELDWITLYAKRTPAQQRALDELLAAQHDPQSPLYHRWLTPEEYADRFGLNPADMEKIAGWLRSEGFTIRYQARGRNWIAFSGTAGQVARTFHTSIHHYAVEGKIHYAAAADPSIPAALAGVVAGFRGLNDFHPRPLSVLKPHYTGSSSHFLAPGDLATIYDIAPLYNMGINGSGQTLVIAGQSDIYASDLAAFRSAFGLPSQSVQQWPNCAAGSVCVLNTGGTDPGFTIDLSEGELDLEWAGAVARNATILYAYSTDVFSSAFYAIDNHLGSVLSTSYGICEAYFQQLGDGTLLFGQSEAQKANSLGMTWVSSAGDSGAAACDWNGDATPTAATQGLAVSFPASIPEVTAVGGSEFNEGSGSYWNTVQGANGGTAKSYIPEMSWNDTVYGTGLETALAAGGGGVSTTFGTPPWQTGPGFPNDGGRDVPDVALSASVYHDAYIMCLKVSCFDQYNDPNVPFGGTSGGAPVFGGILTLLNQYLVSEGLQAQPGLGNVNPTLYALAHSSAFHDITAGSNIVPCQAGTPNCSGGSFGYSAGPGYDHVTGLGSIDVANLAGNWAAAISGASGTPFGSFDTPSGTTSSVNGSVAFTGWALAASGISSVDVWREPNPNEGTALVYVGSAESTPGARPDVQSRYPGYPGAATAGWGLLMLTNELPSNNGAAGVGNGTYRVHALAHDVAGHTTDLGIKTIVVDNKDATTPFGTIDTPTQGGIASGAGYVNFGWVLTPAGKNIPINGSTIWVYVDGKPVGHPVYNNYRADIANLFPGYANSNGAVGYYTIDTTKLANGLHTISWSVTDNAGAGSGIGSRFFTVQN